MPFSLQLIPLRAAKVVKQLVSGAEQLLPIHSSGWCSKSSRRAMYDIVIVGDYEVRYEVARKPDLYPSPLACPGKSVMIQVANLSASQFEWYCRRSSRHRPRMPASVYRVLCANIRNPNTPKAYAWAVREFANLDAEANGLNRTKRYRTGTA